MLKLTPVKRQLLASYTAALGSLALGAGVGWTSPNKKIIDGYYKFSVSKSDYDWIIALLPLGAAIICIPIGFIMDVIGRKTAMIIMIPPFVIAWILIIWPQHIYMLFAGRFMVGVCGGAYSVLVPIYSTEIAETRIRGLIGSSYQIFFMMGVLYAWTMGAIFDVFVTSILCAILPIIFGVCLYFLPESPMYLLKHDEWDQAIYVLQRLRGDDPSIYYDLRELAHGIHYANAAYQPFHKVVCLKRTHRCLVLASMLVIFEQMSGIDIILHNTYDLLKSYTYTTLAKVDVILVGIVQAIVTCVSTLLVDRWGRRLLCMVATFYLSLCCLILGIFYRVWENSRKTADKISWLVILTVAVYVIMYSIGLGAIPWLFNAEIFAHNVKGIGTSFVAAIHWLFAFSFAIVYINVQEHLALSTLYFSHTFFLLVIFFLILMFMPETNQKTFKEIQMLMDLKLF